MGWTPYHPYDRRGFARHSSRFEPRDLAVDLSGRTALITGGTSGIGLCAARGLRRLGAQVVVVGRDADKGRAAIATLRGDGGAPVGSQGGDGAGAEFLRADIAEADDVAALVIALERRQRRIDFVVNNAGAMPLVRTLTRQGDELTFASHVLGHFALTRLVLDAPALRPRKVVWVSSGGMYLKRLDVEDLTFEARPYDQYAAYANAKRAQVVLCQLLSEEPALKDVFFAAMHPGWVDTPAVRASMPWFARMVGDNLRTPDEGADTILWLLGREGLPSGRFWFDRAEREVQLGLLGPLLKEDDGARQWLWSACQRYADEVRARVSQASSSAHRS